MDFIPSSEGGVLYQRRTVLWATSEEGNLARSDGESIPDGHFLMTRVKREFYFFHK